MTSSLHLTEACLRHLLAAFCTAPLALPVKLGLGLSVTVRLDPRKVRLEGDTVILPLEPDRLPPVNLKLRDFAVAAGWLSLKVDGVTLGGFRLPAAALLASLAGKLTRGRGQVSERDGKLAVNLDELLRDQPLRVTALTVDNGVSLEFEPR